MLGSSSTIRMVAFALMTLLFRPHRQKQRERAAMARLALNPNFSCVGFDQASGDGQTKSHTVRIGGLLQPKEFIEDLLVILRRNPRTGVRHVDSDRVRLVIATCPALI